MDTVSAVDAARQGLLIVVLVSMPFIVVGTVMGLLLAIAQAVTQIQDQTIGQSARLVAVMATLGIAGGWAASEMLAYGLRLFELLPATLRH